jgi:hypothetical protein
MARGEMNHPASTANLADVASSLREGSNELSSIAVAVWLSFTKSDLNKNSPR